MPRAHGSSLRKKERKTERKEQNIENSDKESIDAISLAQITEINNL